jgi:Pyruvate/2-oxoacid:ferredoxin oxidoreductase delta subunit/DNA-binding MarR family transcriptional regulator
MMNASTAYQQLAEAIGVGESARIAKIFELLADDNEAQILLAASPPATIDEISEKTGLASNDVERMIEPLFKKGLIFQSKKPDATRYYRVRQLLQFHDATAVAHDVSSDVLDLWKEFMNEEWPEYSKKVEEFLPQPVVRVIPVNVSIESTAQVLAFDDVQAVVEGARSLAVTNCSCRVIERKCDSPLEVCLQVNRAADYAIERGTGRELTKQEALDILKLCEEEGLIHVADNKREVAHVICNCCNCCCMNWPSLTRGLGKLVAPSRFQAQVDEDLCTGCETCVERCPLHFISMDGDVACVDSERCIGCGVCTVTCPADAITLEEVRPADFVPS